MKKPSPPGIIVFFLVLNTALALYATPVTDLGDAPHYIDYSRKMLGEPVAENFAHRSPLFPALLALLIKILGIPLAYKIAVILHYGLVFLASLLLLRIFAGLFVNPYPPFLIALMFNLSFSTIYFADTLISETLALFLTLLSVWLLFRYHEARGRRHLLLLGISVGLLALARFNAVPLLATFSGLLLYLLFVERRLKSGKGILGLALLLAPCLLIVTSWSLYNLDRNGFFGVFPLGTGGVSRNVVVASIRPGNEVSPRNREVREIFIRAAAEAKKIEGERPANRYSISGRLAFLKTYCSGHGIYRAALPELKAHFGLPEECGEHEINEKLGGFYAEIKRQNRGFINRARFYSLLSSFSASAAGHLPDRYGDKNLNALPVLLFKLYKLCVPAVSIFVFLAFLVWGGMLVISRARPSFPLLTLFAIVFSFWGISFLFAAAGNSGRYKYPSEPLIIGLFVYFMHGITSHFKKKRQEGVF